MKRKLKHIITLAMLLLLIVFTVGCSNNDELEAQYQSQLNELRNEIGDLQKEVDKAYDEGYEKGYDKGEIDQKNKNQSSQKTSSASSSASTSTQTNTNTKSYNYVLNTSSKKFHYSSCGSVKQMKAKNTDYFTGTREAIIALGYSPCGKCKP